MDLILLLKRFETDIVPQLNGNEREDNRDNVHTNTGVRGEERDWSKRVRVFRPSYLLLLRLP